MRRVHHVGTIPARGPRDAMVLATSHTGHMLHSLSDGENTPKSATDHPRGRLDWIIPTMERRMNRPEVMVLKKLHYRDRPTFMPWNTCICRQRIGSTLTMDSMELDYSHHAVLAETYLREMQRWTGNPKLALQVGIAPPLDLAVFTWGPWFHHYYQLEVDAALREINWICDLNIPVMFQMECPAELLLATKLGFTTEWVANKLTQFIGRMPSGSRIILHSCDGDPHGQQINDRKTMKPVVDFTNAVIRSWPTESGQVLDAVHLPIRESTNDYLAPLAGLVVPPEVDIIAGLAGPYKNLASQGDTLQKVDQTVGRTAGVAAPCGYGRVSETAAEQWIQYVALLAKTKSGLTKPATEQVVAEESEVLKRLGEN